GARPTATDRSLREKRQPQYLTIYQNGCEARFSLLLRFSLCRRFLLRNGLRAFLLSLLFHLPVGCGNHLRHTFRLCQSLVPASLLTRVFLFTDFALMLLVLKFVNLLRPDLGNLEVSHLLSAHNVKSSFCYSPAGNACF